MSSFPRSTLALWLGLALVLIAGAGRAGPVNINTADAATLSRELSGIGLKRAQAIVEYRQQHGPFRSVEEITLVKGIGPAALEKNRALIRLEVKPVAKAAAVPATSAAPARQSGTIVRQEPLSREKRQ